MTIELTDAQKIKILNSDDVYSVMQEILVREEKIDQEKEHFWMLGLAQNNRIQYIELISLGSVKATTIEPMNVFRWAVMKGVVSVIMVHNHPSGELKPSAADKDVTDRLIQVGRILNIQVYDHLVISTRSYFSFGDSGIMEELRKSTTWVPTYELIERVKEEEKKIREEAIRAEREKARAERERARLQLEKARIDKERALLKGRKEGLEEGLEIGKIEMARNSIKEGLPIELIAKLTGLTREEIEKFK